MSLSLIFSDLTMHELETLPKDLQLCTDMATGVDSLGQYQFNTIRPIPGTFNTIGTSVGNP